MPKGMYLIKSGQCILGLTRVAYRDKQAGSRKPIESKNPLFDNYDPENSLLNGVKQRDRAFQNERIYVAEDGKPLKNQIAFEDILEYSKMMPKGMFGGRTLLPFELYL